MSIYNHSLYIEDIYKTSEYDLPWNELINKRIVISGGTGMIGSFLVDVLMNKNFTSNLNCSIYILTRNKKKAQKRFNNYKNKNLHFIEIDINKDNIEFDANNVDYVIHLASSTHPVAYAEDPIGTITSNVIGTKNLLDFASRQNKCRFLFASSNEIYGENRGDVEFFNEDYCGYINSNTLRAGYPESKRCGEALCQAYKKQKKLDVVIARLTRSFGPTLLKTDTKAMSQFLNNAINKENIVLKSDGSQFYSYTYVADAVSGLLTVLLNGQNGEAYNIADEKCDITLKQLAEMVAEIAGVKVSYDLPDSVEKEGFSKVTKARLDGNKIKSIKWHASTDLYEGIKRTLTIMKEL